MCRINYNRLSNVETSDPVYIKNFIHLSLTSKIIFIWVIVNFFIRQSLMSLNAFSLGTFISAIAFCVYQKNL